MEIGLDHLYRELTLSLTEKRLGLLASRLIAAYRDKDFTLIRTAAAALLDTGTEGEKDSVLFVRAIKLCHPDRTASLRKEAENAFNAGDRETLLRLGRLFHTEKASASTAVRRPVEYSPEPEEYTAEPDFGAADGGYGFDEYLETDEEYWSEEEETTFLSVLREELIGNLDFTLTPADLAQLDGELDLSGRDLTELHGLEYCRHIGILILSGNNLDRITEAASLHDLRELYLEGNDISDISPLSGLPHLEILDISGNDIDDISPLLGMTGLKFVDMRNNPLKNHQGIVGILEKRGIAVLV
jgi:hypothetical protein